MPRARSSLLAVALLAACARPEPPRPPPAPVPVEAAPPVAVAPPPAAAPAPPAPKRPWPPPAPGVETSFCLPGVLEALAEDACYLLPDAPTDTLLVYLPGLMPPDAESPEKRSVETVVARAARRAGVAALVPRGPTRSELSPSGRDPKGMGPYRSWPTSDDAYHRHTPRLVARIQALREALAALAGAPFSRVYLAGSSAGGYYVGHLALRGDFPADGYAALSGGSARPAPRRAEPLQRALYVGFGDGDIVGETSRELAAQARAAGFRVRISVLHTGHGAREAYLDEAFGFFAAREP